jgi:hypothetical protein
MTRNFARVLCLCTAIITRCTYIVVGANHFKGLPLSEAVAARGAKPELLSNSSGVRGIKPVQGGRRGAERLRAVLDHFGGPIIMYLFAAESEYLRRSTHYSQSETKELFYLWALFQSP